MFSKCLCICKCHCICIFVGQVRSCFVITLRKMSKRSQLSKIALWRCSLNVFLLVRSCILITLIRCLKCYNSTGLLCSVLKCLIVSGRCARRTKEGTDIVELFRDSVWRAKNIKETTISFYISLNRNYCRSEERYNKWSGIHHLPLRRGCAHTIPHCGRAEKKQDAAIIHTLCFPLFILIGWKEVLHTLHLL